MVRRRRPHIAVAHLLVQAHVSVLAHQVDACLAALAHLRHEARHQLRRVALALEGGVQHHRHDHHVRRLGVMADQLLEGFIGHHHLMGATTVDEADHLSVQLQHQEPLGVLGDAQGDLFLGGRFVTFVGRGFDLEATLCVLGSGGAEDWAAHG